MNQDECKARIDSKLAQLREEKATGPVLIALDFHLGGVRNVSFYKGENKQDKKRVLFSSTNGPIIMEKHI